jgi:hypothetical protein
VIERTPKNVTSEEAKAGRLQPSVLSLAMRKKTTAIDCMRPASERQQKRVEKIRR